MPQALCSTTLSRPLTIRARQRLADLEVQGLRRTPPVIEQRDGVRYRVGDCDVIGFCSNDYLGFASAPPLSTPPTATPPHGPQARPAGAGASRLISGDLPEHRDLERRLARVARAEDAVLFSSGFALNVGVLPALIRQGDQLYSDRLIHASLIDGLRLSRVKPTILDHLASPPVRTLEGATRHPDTLRWWIGETLYSMDGTRPDPHALRTWQRAGNVLVLDGAHDFGCFPHGGGWAQAHDIQADIYVGTLGKAYGAAGAFVAADREICEELRNRARSYVFTTGVSPVLTRQLHHHLHAVTGPEGDARRAALADRIAQLSDALRTPLTGPIIPLAVGDPRVAVDLSTRLLTRGVHVQAIRPPTVPPGTSRLRLTLSAAHQPGDVDALVDALHAVFRDAHLPLEVRGRP